MKTLIKILPIMLMTAGQTSAQTTMGLRECMQYAVENSTKIAVEDERQSQYAINRRDARLNAFTPSVSASSSVSYSSGRIPDPETNMYSTLKTIQDSYQLYGEIQRETSNPTRHRVMPRNIDQLVNQGFSK